MDLWLQLAICHAQKCAESTEENAEVSVGNWRLFISGRSSIITNVRLWSDFRPVHGRPTTTAAAEGKLFQEQEINFFFSHFSLFFSRSPVNIDLQFFRQHRKKSFLFQVVTITIFHENSLCVYVGAVECLGSRLKFMRNSQVKWKWKNFFLLPDEDFPFSLNSSGESTLVGMEPATSDDVKVFSLFSITRVQQHNCALCV